MTANERIEEKAQTGKTKGEKRQKGKRGKEEGWLSTIFEFEGFRFLKE